MPNSVKMAKILIDNRADPTQEGCVFEVDNAEAAFEELKSKGLTRQAVWIQRTPAEETEEAGLRIDQHGATSYEVIFRCSSRRPLLLSRRAPELGIVRPFYSKAAGRPRVMETDSRPDVRSQRHFNKLKELAEQERLNRRCYFGSAPMH